MRKKTIVRLFVGSLIGFGAAVLIFLTSGALLLANNVFVMQGPDVVGVQPGAFGWSMISVAGISLLAMAIAGIMQVVAWIGAVLNTGQVEDKTWFIVVLVLGLVGFGFPVMIAYAIAGPDGVTPTPALEQVPMRPAEQIGATTGRAA